MDTDSFKCVLCDKLYVRKHGRSLADITNKDLTDHITKLKGTVLPTKVICNPCRVSFYRQKRRDSNQDANVIENNASSSSQANDTVDVPGSLQSPKRIKLSLPRTSLTHRKCQFCKSTEDLVLINEDIRTTVFIDKGILIPEGSRSCRKHLTKCSVDSTALENLRPISNSSDFNRTDLTKMLQKLRDKCNKTSSGINFEDPSALSDDDYYNLTGITKNQFSALSASLTSLRNSSNRSVRTTLALFFTMLRTGNSLNVLSSMFQIKDKSIVSKAIKSAREALIRDFVPQNLGFKHMSRDEFITKHTRPFVQSLLADGKPVAILVLDGTYIYIEKSSNYSFQHLTFSGHKHQPLVKPMMVVGTDGYILSVLGPYLADSKNNDASILTDMLESNTEEMKEWLQEDDLFVVDRGFRDCLGFLDKLGIQNEMPDFLPKGQKQHTTEEANHSRLVTKVRWVVESANGRIKRWKALDQVMPNSQSKYIGDYVRIVCSLCNKFRPPLIQESPDDTILELEMNFLAKKANALQQSVENENLATKRAVWKNLNDVALNDFPKLTGAELRDLTLGVYQLKQARSSYTQKHLSVDGSYDISVHRHYSCLIRAKIQSRHISSKSYNLWISFDSERQPSILGWYCLCKVGSRTIGCCAHIAAVLWYLGYQRHQTDNLSLPTDHSEHFLNAADADWNSNDDEDDEVTFNSRNSDEEDDNEVTFNIH